MSLTGHQEAKPSLTPANLPFQQFTVWVWFLLTCKVLLSHAPVLGYPVLLKNNLAQSGFLACFQPSGFYPGFLLGKKLQVF